MAQTIRLVVLTSFLVALGGCFDDDPHVNQFPDGETPAANTAPTISGTPPTDIVEGDFYEFTPTAEDADGDPLRFSVYHKPDWASFDQQTGRLWGTPAAGDVGNFSGITIAAWDGQVTASLDAFSITVGEIALGSTTLSWNPPTQNSDGTVLSDLAGYRIYYGRDVNSLGRTVDLNNPGLTRYVIENLSSDVWYFTMSSFNSDGVESGRSAVIRKSIG
jgi:hypothetical protein